MNLSGFFGGAFDSSVVPPSTDFAPVPSGEYEAIITDSDVKPTTSGTGEYLELTHQIISGPFSGRLVWARLNLKNDNTQTVEIAQRNLSAICHATCVMAPSDSVQLHNIPMLIRVELVPADSKRSRDGNEIRSWKRRDGATPPAALVQHAAALPNKASFTQPQAPALAPAWAR